MPVTAQQPGIQLGMRRTSFLLSRDLNEGDERVPPPSNDMDSERIHFPEVQNNETKDSETKCVSGWGWRRERW